MLTNTTTSYGWLSILFHWLSALLVFALFGLGWWMVELDYYHPWYNLGPYWHTSVGGLFSMLLLLRLCWRMIQPSPAPLGAGWSRRLAKLGHLSMLALLVLLMVSGYLMVTADGKGLEVFEWFTLPALPWHWAQQADMTGDWHRWIAYTLMALVLIHSIAALRHHFSDRDATLKRMLSPQQPKE